MDKEQILATSTQVPSNEGGSFTPEEFIKRWLQLYPPNTGYRTFKWVPLEEQQTTRPQILPLLARTVFVHHNDPIEFKEIVAELGYKRAAELFDKRPRDDKTRKANLGEIIASEYLRQQEGYELPVYRLRWNTNPDTSMRGEDALAFKFGDADGRGRELCVAEAKVMSRFESQTVLEACVQLGRGKRPRPNSIPFVCSVLRLEGKPDKARLVLTFLNRITRHRPRRTYFLLLVTGNRTREPFSVLKTVQVPRNLTAANVYVKDLNRLINRVFSSAVQI